jgi:hypothetical protein
MVFNSAPQTPNTYTLFQRFSYPTKHGVHDAIAVSKTTGSRMTSVYTILLGIILGQLWEFAVIAAVHIANKKPSTPNTELNIEVNKYRSRLPELMWLLVERLVGSSNRAPEEGRRVAEEEQGVAEHTTKPKEHVRWFLFFWIILVGAAWGGAPALITVLIPTFILGNGAPVASDSIYFPQVASLSTEPLDNANFVQIQIPSAFRAAGSAFVADSATKKKISVTNPPNVLMKQSDGQPVLEMGYSYSLNARDFGMQHFDGLSLNVQGSCYTEYSWIYTGGSNVVTYNGVSYPVDNYTIFGDAAWTSEMDGWAPRAFFYPGSSTNITTNAGTIVNSTYAILISSVNRTSYYPNTDPWYLTDENSSAPDAHGDPRGYRVKPQRPALSCWETAIWSYQGHNSSLQNLAAIQGLKFPETLQKALEVQLGQPMILSLGQPLGTQALASSANVIDFLFDGGSSSVYNDIYRLVLTAYIATANVLTDSTLHDMSALKLPNLFTSDNITGVAEFVVYSPDVTTFSLVSIILIPLLALTLWVLAKVARHFVEPKEKPKGSARNVRVYSFLASNKPSVSLLCKKVCSLLWY